MPGSPGRWRFQEYQGCAELPVRGYRKLSCQADRIGYQHQLPRYGHQNCPHRRISRFPLRAQCILPEQHTEPVPFFQAARQRALRSMNCRYLTAGANCSSAPRASMPAVLRWTDGMACSTENQCRRMPMPGRSRPNSGTDKCGAAWCTTKTKEAHLAIHSEQ